MPDLVALGLVVVKGRSLRLDPAGEVGQGRIRVVFRGVGADPSVREANTILLRPTIPNDVPVETARAAFPHGALLSLRDELGLIFDDERFAALFPRLGKPAEAPWRYPAPFRRAPV